MIGKEYIIIIQCHLVKQRCSGYFCEKAFHERSGGFANFAKDKSYRTLNITCGGCCGQALGRKLTHLKRTLKKKEDISKDKARVTNLDGKTELLDWIMLSDLWGSRQK